MSDFLEAGPNVPDLNQLSPAGKFALRSVLLNYDPPAEPVKELFNLHLRLALRQLGFSTRAELAQALAQRKISAETLGIAVGEFEAATSLLGNSTSNPRTLTSREQEVHDLVVSGMKNNDVARELGIRSGTVKIHLRHIFEKLDVRNRVQLIARSFEAGS